MEKIEWKSKKINSNVLLLSEDEKTPWKYRSLEDLPFQYNEIKIIQCSDLKSIGPWKDIFTIILKRLDFRDLLSLKICSKDFKTLAEIEIERREKHLRNFGEFYSDIDDWFLGRRCYGFTTAVNYNEEADTIFHNTVKLVKDECNLFEELTTIGDYNMCGTCLEEKRLIENYHNVELARRYKKQEIQKRHENLLREYREINKNKLKRQENYNNGIIGVEGEQLRNRNRPLFRTKNSSDL